MKYFLYILFLITALFLQAYFLALPLVMGAIVITAILFPKWWIFLVAVFLGATLDVLTFHQVGLSSIFFVISLGGIFLYSRKFEIQNPLFVCISIFLTCLMYGAFFIQKYSFWGALVCSILMTVVYTIVIFVSSSRRKNDVSF